MQEAAQVVTCIKQYLFTQGKTVSFQLTLSDQIANKYSRLTVAQDGKQMYIIISAYRESYLGYVNDNEPTDDFMTMTQYGPYNIDNADDDVNKFASIVLSYFI
jgi:hypothetical protein